MSSPAAAFKAIIHEVVRKWAWCAGHDADATVGACLDDARPCRGVYGGRGRILPGGERRLRGLRQPGQPGRAAVRAQARMAHQPGQLHGCHPPGCLLPGDLSKPSNFSIIIRTSSITHMHHCSTMNQLRVITAPRLQCMHFLPAALAGLASRTWSACSVLPCKFPLGSFQANKAR